MKAPPSEVTSILIIPAQEFVIVINCPSFGQMSIVLVLGFSNNNIFIYLMIVEKLIGVKGNQRGGGAYRPSL